MDRNLIIQKFNKFIKDELSAAAGYHFIAEKLQGKDIANVVKELKEHGKEEFTHFTQLVEYAANHGFLNELNLTLDQNVVSYEPKTLEDTVAFIQNLEKQARADYKEMVMLAKDNGDVEMAEFFKELMKDETGHFDDLNYVLGDIIEIGESANEISLAKIIEKLD